MDNRRFRGFTRRLLIGFASSATLLVFAAGDVLAQAPAIQWQESLGGSLNDGGGWPIRTRDSNYIFIATSYSNDGDVTGHHGTTATFDEWIVKLDTVGRIIWEKSLGGAGDDYPGKIIQTKDGGYVVFGWTTSNDGDVTGNHGGKDYWLVKLDSLGNIIWQKTYGGTQDEECDGGIQTQDGGFMLAGHSSSNDGDVSGHHGMVGSTFDVWLVKVDSLGNLMWERSYGGTNQESQGVRVVQTSDGGYFFAGPTLSNDGDVSGNHGDWDYWAVRLSPTGSILWQKCLGGSGEEDGSYDIQKTSDNGFILTGCSQSNDGDVTGHHGPLSTKDRWVVRIDSVGKILWQRSYGGSGDETGYGVTALNNGGFILDGGSTSNDGDVTGHHGTLSTTDAWEEVIDSDGNVIWQKSLGGSGNELGNMIPAIGGGFLLVGNSYSNDGDVSGHHGDTSTSDVWVVKLEDCKSFTIVVTGNDTFCLGTTTILHATPGFAAYHWNDGSGSDSEIVSKSGSLWVYGENTEGCSSDTAFVTVTALAPPNVRIDSSGPLTTCAGDSVLLWVIGAHDSVSWWRMDSATHFLGSSDTVRATGSGIYTAIASNNEVCLLDTTTATVVVAPVPVPAQILPDTILSLCEAKPDTLRSSTHSASYVWQDTTGKVVSTDSTLVTAVPGRYVLTVTDSLGCSSISPPASIVLQAGPLVSLSIDSAKQLAGHYANIRLTLGQTIPPLSIDTVRALLGYNNDLLSTDSVWSECGGTAQVQRIDRKHVLVTVIFSSPFELSDTSCIVANIRTKAMLTDTMESAVTVDSISLSKWSGNRPFVPCSVTNTSFALDPECGDPTLQDAMQGNLLFRFVSVYPNPASGNLINVVFEVPAHYPANLEVTDALGRSISRVAIKASPEAGTRTIQLPMSATERGAYFLRLSLSDEPTEVSRMISVP